jgi:hypothetical protein
MLAHLNTLVPHSKGGLVELGFRSTGFESMLAANVIFVPVGTNFVKPFVTLGHFDSNGLIKVSLSPKEFEDSQK